MADARGATTKRDIGHIAGQARLTNGEVHAVVIRPSDAPRIAQATVTGNHVVLSWTAATAAPAGMTYLLRVGSSMGTSNLFAGSVGPSTTLSGDVPNGTYFASVVMVYPNGAWSGVSNEVSLVVPAPPAAPTDLHFTLTARRLTLSWTAPAGGAATYIIEAGSQSGAANLFHGNIGSAPGVSADVPPGTYFIRVRAVSAAGAIGSASTELVVTVS